MLKTYMRLGKNLECCTGKLTDRIIKNDYVTNCVLFFCILFLYKNTLCKNTEAQITQKIRTIQEQ